MFFDSHITALQDCKMSLLTRLAQASAVHMKQLLADEESIQLSCTRLTSARNFAQQQLSSASSTDLAMMSKKVIQQLETLRKVKLKSAPYSLLREVSLTEDDPLRSKIQSLSTSFIANAIAVSDLADSAVLGKNTFQIRVNNVPKTFNLITPEVTVTLSSGDSCPVEIKSTGSNLWSVTYFIAFYPEPRIRASAENNDSYDESHVTRSSTSRMYEDNPTGVTTYTAPTVKVSVEIYGMQVKNSPFNLQLKKEIPTGTRVQHKYSEQQRGTVVEYLHSGNVKPTKGSNPFGRMRLADDGYAFVQWDDSGPNSRHYDIDQLKVLP